MNSIKTEEWFIDEKKDSNGLINIQIKLNKDTNRKEIIDKLMESVKKSTEIMNGVTVNQIYFNGVDVDKYIDKIKTKIKTQLNNIINELNI